MIPTQYPRKAAATAKLRRAFTLVEMIVVVAIMIILMSVVAPITVRSIQSIGLSAQGAELQNTLIHARQLAITDNATVQVRFLSYVDPATTDPAPRFRAVSIIREFIDDSGIETIVELEPTIILRNPAVITEIPDMSSLVDSTTNSDLMTGDETSNPTYSPTIGDGNGFDFVAFEFYSDGSCSLPYRAKSGTDTWHISIIKGLEEEVASNNSSSTPPKNFYTVVLDTSTGATSVLRP